MTIKKVYLDYGPKATVKQKALMTSLEIAFNHKTTLNEAKKLISKELNKKKEKSLQFSIGTAATKIQVVYMLKHRIPFAPDIDQEQAEVLIDRFKKVHRPSSSGVTVGDTVECYLTGYRGAITGFTDDRAAMVQRGNEIKVFSLEAVKHVP